LGTYISYLVQEAQAFVPKLLTALLILVLSLYLAKLLSRLLREVLERRKADHEVTLLLSQVARWGIIILGSITALQRFFDVTAFLAGLGILGFSVGFALQNIMQNFAAGVVLLIQQPFNVGDAVEVSDYSGSVLAINLRATEIRTWDGRIVILPNAEILSKAIINFTRAERRRIDIALGISYEADPGLTRSTILRALEEIEGVLSEPAPLIVFQAYSESSFDLTVFFWIEVAKSDLFMVKNEALTRIKAALEQAGVEMPYPTQVVHLKREELGPAG
jgi:small conductance mechanosensitive channel